MTKRGTIVIIVVGLIAVAWSGPLVRLASGAEPLAIAFWRTAIATSVLMPLALGRHLDEIRSLRAKDWLLLAASGAFLALHFATWIASVNLTTVASSVLLVNTTPVFVAAASAVIGERLSARGWAGIALAITGATLVGGAGLGSLAEGGRGNLLAVSGAAAAAGYLLIGRAVRPNRSLLTYVTLVYGTCGLIVLLAALITGTQLIGFDRPTQLTLLAIGIGPQLVGHTVFNFLLDRLEAAKVTVAIMGEPIGAALIALWLFGEIPPALVVPGGVLLLAGIAVVTTARGKVPGALPGG